MMIPDERDALIDATVEACAKLAENYHERVVAPGSTAAALVKKIGREIARGIREEFKKP
jgi:hypothetical protein